MHVTANIEQTRTTPERSPLDELINDRALYQKARDLCVETGDDEGAASFERAIARVEQEIVDLFPPKPARLITEVEWDLIVRGGAECSDQR